MDYKNYESSDRSRHLLLSFLLRELHALADVAPDYSPQALRYTGRTSVTRGLGQWKIRTPLHGLVEKADDDVRAVLDTEIPASFRRNDYDPLWGYGRSL